MQARDLIVSSPTIRPWCAHIIHENDIFTWRCDWSKYVTCPNVPSLKFENINLMISPKYIAQFSKLFKVEQRLVVETKEDMWSNQHTCRYNVLEQCRKTQLSFKVLCSVCFGRTLSSEHSESNKCNNLYLALKISTDIFPWVTYILGNSVSVPRDSLSKDHSLLWKGNVRVQYCAYFCAK